VSPEKTIDIANKIVEITGRKFKVINALELNTEWSLVGYWLNGNDEPEIPHVQHVLVTPDLIELLAG
jgi:hypothetical protein